MIFLKYGFAICLLLFSCVTLAESGEQPSGLFKDFILAVIDVLKIPLTVLLSLWLFKGKIRLFILRDIVVKRLNEIDSIKRKVRGKAVSALSELRGIDNMPRNIYIDDSDLKYAVDILSDIEEEAVHAERGVASISMISSRFFNYLKVDFARFNRRNAGSYEILKNDFYSLLISNIEYIEQLCARSIEVPDEVAFNQSMKFGSSAWPLISQTGPRQIAGVNQGAYINPYDYNCAHYFFSVFDFSIRNSFYLANKTFFSMLKGYQISYFYFIFHKWCVPNELPFKNRVSLIDEKPSLGFIGAKENVSFVGLVRRENIDIYYANLNPHLILINYLSIDDVSGIFNECFGFPPGNIIIYGDLEVVKITVLKSQAEYFYKKNILDISYNAYKASGKSFFAFSFEAVKNKSPLVVFVSLAIIRNVVKILLSILEWVLSSLKGLITYLIAKLFTFICQLKG